MSKPWQHYPYLALQGLEGTVHHNAEIYIRPAVYNDLMLCAGLRMIISGLNRVLSA